MTSLPKAAIEAAESAFDDHHALPLDVRLQAAILAALPHLGEPAAWVHASAIDEFNANSAMRSFEGVQTVLWAYGGEVRGKLRIPIFLTPPSPTPDPIRAQLVEALKPFAFLSQLLKNANYDDAEWVDGKDAPLQAGDFHRARAALAAAEENSQIPVDTIPNKR